jgi:hypothetical protein
MDCPDSTLSIKARGRAYDPCWLAALRAEFVFEDWNFLVFASYALGWRHRGKGRPRRGKL